MISNHPHTHVRNYTVTLTVTDIDGTFSSESAIKKVEKEEILNGPLSLFFLAAIGFGVIGLTFTLLYCLIIGRKKNVQNRKKSCISWAFFALFNLKICCGS